MKTPLELWQLYVSEQDCVFCSDKISDLPYYPVPDMDGFAHSECLAVHVDLQMSQKIAA